MLLRAGQHAGTQRQTVPGCMRPSASVVPCANTAEGAPVSSGRGQGDPHAGGGGTVAQVEDVGGDGASWGHELLLQPEFGDLDLLPGGVADFLLPGGAQSLFQQRQHVGGTAASAITRRRKPGPPELGRQRRRLLDKPARHGKRLFPVGPWVEVLAMNSTP